MFYVSQYDNAFSWRDILEPRVKQAARRGMTAVVEQFNSLGCSNGGPCAHNPCRRCSNLGPVQNKIVAGILHTLYFHNL
jgi:hypothetical protein